jgi:hypothetical protein
MTDTAFSKASEGAPSAADQQSTAPVTSTTTTQTIPPEVSELIGEGKKYATIEAALKSIPHAQTHITRLEQETADLRARKADVDEVLANMGKGSSQEVQTTSIDENTVADRVIARLTAKEQDALKSTNLITASDKLAVKAGSVEGAAAMIVQKAKELGLTTSDLQRIAEKSPTAFLAYFNETLPKTTDKLPMSKAGVNTEALTTNSGRVEEGTYAWYQAQRKEKGDRWYFSEVTTKSRTKDMDRLGSTKFFGKQPKL